MHHHHCDDHLHHVCFPYVCTVKIIPCSFTSVIFGIVFVCPGQSVIPACKCLYPESLVIRNTATIHLTLLAANYLRRGKSLQNLSILCNDL